MRVALENPKSMKGSLSQKNKILIGIAAAAIVVIIGIAALIAKNKQDTANEQAEQAMFEQKKSEVMNNVNSLIDSAEASLAEGLNVENDDYEKALIRAYNQFTDAETAVSNDSIYDISLPDVAAKKQQIVESLKQAMNQFQQQADALKELGENEQAEGYLNRIKDIEIFINNK